MIKLSRKSVIIKLQMKALENLVVICRSRTMAANTRPLHRTAKRLNTP